MAFPKLFKTKVAAENRAKFDLSSTHITSSDFGQITPALIHEILPGDSFNINMSSFIRLSSMALPTYGMCDLQARAFFIPSRSIFRFFPEFITRSKACQGTTHFTPSSVPYITNKAIVDWFIDDLTHPGSSTQFDFSSNGRYYMFTHSGRHIYKILVSLGYSINWTTGDTSETMIDNTKMSALPLLSFIKVIIDWYLNPRFDDITQYDYLFSNKGVDPLLTSDDLSAIESLFIKYFESDYFTSSWVSPNQSGSQINVNATINSVAGDDTYNYNRTRADSTNKYVTTGEQPSSSSSVQSVSNLGLDALYRLSRYIKRNNLVGNRYIDQLFARFGVKMDDVVLNRSSYLGSYNSPINISDVTCTSTGENSDGDISVLGDVTGKGIGYGNGSFQYDAREHGFILVTYTIYPRAKYYQGRNRYLQHLTPFDFFTPEYDSLGMQAIRNDELFSSFNNQQDYEIGLNYGGKPDGIFGYSPRYAEYKCATKDVLSGDFRVNTRNANMQGYHLFRTFAEPSSNYPLSNTRNFRTLNRSSQSDYDRMFVLQSPDYDHFFIFFEFKVSAYRKMKTLGEDLLDEHEHGDTISIRPDSTKF